MTMRKTVSRAVLAGALLAMGLTSAPVQAAFPGANGAIFYLRSQPGNNRIERANPDGSATSFVAESTHGGSGPSISPDGRFMLFSSNRLHEGQTDFEIYVQNLDTPTASPVQLTFNDATDAEPVWSPDGSKIAFTVGENQNRDVFTMDSNGANQRNITNTPNDDYAANWGVNNQIVFVSHRSGPDIYKMNPDGSAQTRLTLSDGIDGGPNWSPDATKIVYSGTINGVDQINVMNADGTGITPLTTDTAMKNLQPAWSPDGTQIVFSKQPVAGGAQELWTMSSTGGTPLKISTTGDFYIHAEWAPVPPDVLYPRSIVFRTKKHLVASGTIASTHSACIGGQAIAVQRKSRGGWSLVKGTVTDSAGAFKVKIKDRPGTYRAVLPEVRAASPAGTVCGAAFSNKKRHAHRR